MPYVERVTKAGNTIEIERYFTSRYKKKGISRGDKVKPTKEEQEKVNKIPPGLIFSNALAFSFR